ncbi:MAG TPA: DUF1761 domain-containing protein [Candidatus Binatia bacterium]|nr:DUF1761 domain-containing protein [Candidatus Binatia bacterium]
MRLNWSAIVVAGVADWVLGAVWFTAFANQWKAGLRMPPEELQAYSAHPNYWPYLIALLCSILIAYVIARVLAIAETHTLLRGISAGVLVGFAAAVAMVTEMVFEIRAGSFILISAAYPLLGGILMGIVIGAWKPKRTGETGARSQP